MIGEVLSSWEISNIWEIEWMGLKSIHEGELKGENFLRKKSIIKMVSAGVAGEKKGPVSPWYTGENLISDMKAGQ